MQCQRFTHDGVVQSYRLVLSAAETAQWANSPRGFVDSKLGGRAVTVRGNRDNRLWSLIEGQDDPNAVGIDIVQELEALVSDFLPADCRHLWPCNETTNNRFMQQRRGDPRAPVSSVNPPAPGTYIDLLGHQSPTDPWHMSSLEVVGPAGTLRVVGGLPHGYRLWPKTLRDCDHLAAWALDCKKYVTKSKG